MASKAQQNKGYILPAEITGHDLLCVHLLIPNTPEYVAAFRGQLKGLTEWWNWERRSDKGNIDAANYWRQIIHEHLSIYDCATGEPMPITDLRTIEIDGCQQVQYLDYATNTWIDLGTPICNGEDGVTPDCPDCDEPPNEDDGGVDVPPEPAEGADAACQVARAVTDYVLAKYTAVLESYLEEVVTNGMGLLEFSHVVQQLMFGAPNPISALGNLFAWIQAQNAIAAADNLTSAQDEATIEKIFCHLYNALPENGDLTAEVFTAWTTAIAGDTEIVCRADLVAFMESIPLYELRTEAIAAVTFDIDADCSECDECTPYEFTVPANVGGTNGYSTGLMVTSGQTLVFSAADDDYWDVGDSIPRNAAGSGNFMQEFYVLPIAPTGALIARIGETGEWIATGLSSSYPATESGELFFMCNDIVGDHANNSGEIEVTVEVCD